MIPNNNQHAPESIRKENSKAVRQRDDWRKQYGLLSRLIAVKKGQSKLRFSKIDSIELRSLQKMANDMMFDRILIGNWLKNTSYPWV